MQRFSIYTPTHDPQWITDCYRSLQDQTVSNWEWVILKNGSNSFDLPRQVVEDPRVMVRESVVRGVGALKKAAINQCVGEILVELDHDDYLAPNCLEEIGKAADATPGGFYYSDWAGVFPNGAPEVYSSSNGWEQYEARIGSRLYMCQRAFPAVPRALCEIYYAPNHVRAWSREAYDKAGGYSEALPVCDDHDLICRTFLAGVPFVHIDKPLYIYRRHLDPKAENSHAKASDQIVQLSQRNTNIYLHQLIDEWCRRKCLPRLDVARVHQSPDEYISIDPGSDPPMNILPRDTLERLSKWPSHFRGDPLRILRELPPESVGCFRAFDYLGHIPRASMVPLVNEVYRVLAPHGFFISGTPSTDGRGGCMDPTATNFMNQNSFLYYTHRETARYLGGAVDCRFQAVRLWTEMPSDWHRRNFIPYVYADLAAVKGFKHIGPIHI